MKRFYMLEREYMGHPTADVFDGHREGLRVRTAMGLNIARIEVDLLNQMHEQKWTAREYYLARDAALRKLCSPPKE